MHHKEVLYAFLIFILFSLMAAFSASHDQSFVRGILGDGYVEMTEENIANGDPFGVYKDDRSVYEFVALQ
jgi:hypothetical protein